MISEVFGLDLNCTIEEVTPGLGLDKFCTGYVPSLDLRPSVWVSVKCDYVSVWGSDPETGTCHLNPLQTPSTEKKVVLREGGGQRS